jgi:hypothetical protein
VRRTDTVDRSRFRIPLWLWVITVIASAAVLVVAILGWDKGEGPTIRAMAASESMSDAQARAVAENTARAFDRERAAGNLANLEALSCPVPPPHSMLDGDIDEVRRGIRPKKNTQIVATGTFTRRGSVWFLDVFYDGPGIMMEFHILDGELRVCGEGSAPVP